MTGPLPPLADAPVDLREGDGWSRHRLGPDRAAALSESGLVDVRPVRGGGWELRPKAVVGAARIGHGRNAVQLRIRPKVEVDRMLYLLQYAARRAEWRPEPVEAAERPDLLPAIAHAFCTAAERALRPGILLGYRAVEATQSTVRGRILVPEQIRRHQGRSLPLELAYDEHTVDIPENRLLLGASLCLLRLPGVAPALRTRLRTLTARLDAVEPARPRQRVPRWRPDRLNARYGQGLALAELVLRGASYELEDGRSVLVDGLLLRMWQVFEDFVGQAVGAALEEGRPGSFSRTPDQSRSLDAHGREVLEPDLVHYRPGPSGQPVPVAIIDAKYKTGHSRDDLYQMLAYCLRFGVGEGHLVYAGGRPDTVEIPVAGARVLIHRHALDLAAPWPSLSASVASVAAVAVPRRPA